MTGRTIAQDLADVQPYLSFATTTRVGRSAGGDRDERGLKEVDERPALNPRAASLLGVEPRDEGPRLGSLPKVRGHWDSGRSTPLSQASTCVASLEEKLEAGKNLGDVGTWQDKVTGALLDSVLGGLGSADVSAQPSRNAPAFDSDDEEHEDVDIQQDIRQLKRLCALLDRDRDTRQDGNERGLFEGVPLRHGADLMVQVTSKSEFPVHRLVLAARCAVFCDVLHSDKSLQDRASGIIVKTVQYSSSALPRLFISGCQPISILILLVYLYTDNVLSPWDRRVGCAIEAQLIRLNIKPTEVNTDLRHLARILDLHLLAEVLAAPVKRMPSASMTRDMVRLFQRRQDNPTCNREKGSMGNPLAYDVVLQLADRDVYTHATVLRARSSFFAAFFNDNDWTARRWSEDGTITVNLKHMKWRVMDFVLRFMCCGEDIEMFDCLGTSYSIRAFSLAQCGHHVPENIRSGDEFVDFMFEIMAAAVRFNFHQTKHPI